MRISLLLFLSVFVIFSSGLWTKHYLASIYICSSTKFRSAEVAKEFSLSEDVRILNRIARSPGNRVKKENKNKKQNKKRRKENKAEKVKKEKKKKKGNKDRGKRNNAKNSRKTKVKTSKSKILKRKSKKKKEKKKRSRNHRRRSRKNKKNGRGNASKKSSNKCARQNGPDDSTCMANIGTAMDYEGNQVHK